MAGSVPKVADFVSFCEFYYTLLPTLAKNTGDFRKFAPINTCDMKRILSLLLGFIGLASCSNAQSDSIKTVSAAKFEQIIKSDSVELVDVRTADEFAAGHIDGAKNIDVLKDDFEDKACTTLPKDKTIAVYCRSGKRSLKAANILAKDGYKVVNLRGGWLEWTDFKAKGK